MWFCLFLLITYISKVKASVVDELKPLSKAELGQLMAASERHRYTEEIVRGVYDSVVEAASSGKNNYVTDFTGCDNSNPKISEELCKLIVNDVFSIINTKFPDAIISYDINKEFKIAWA
jgi:hypothetical protein